METISSIGKFIGLWGFLALISAAIFAILFESLGIVVFFPFLEILANGNLENANSSGSFAISFVKFCLDIFSLEVSLLSVSLLLSTMFFLKGCMLFLSYVVRALISSLLLKKIRKSLYYDFQRSKYQLFEEKGAGHFSNLMIEQSSKLILSFQFIAQFMAQITNAAGLFLFAVILDWKIAIAFMLAVIIIALIFKKLNLMVRKISVQTASISSELSSIIVQVVGAFKYLKATNSFNNFDEKLNNSINELSILFTKNGIASGFTNALKEPLAIILVIFFLGLIKVQLGLAPENLLVTIALFYRCISNALMAQRQWQNFTENSGSATLIFKEIEELKNNRELELENDNLINFDAITLSNVSVKYEGKSEYALSEINLKINKNQVFAIVGPSGSGKSTLASLLTFLVQPNSGELKFGSINSAQMSKYRWRKKIGYVPQDPILFEGTIIQNLLSQNVSSVSRDEEKLCWNILDRVDLGNFVKTLPKKLNSHIAEGGINLSGGQKQRLALARELLKKPSLLILDEATSSLDLKAEQKFVKLINEIRGEMTIIMIAHRLTSIKEVDMIIYLEAGRILETGRPSDLVNNANSRFSKLVKLHQIGEKVV